MCEYIFVTEFILRSSPELGKRIKFKICDAVGRIEKRLVGRAEETRAEPGSVRRGGILQAWSEDCSTLSKGASIRDVGLGCLSTGIRPVLRLRATSQGQHEYK